MEKQIKEILFWISCVFVFLASGLLWAIGFGVIIPSPSSQIGAFIGVGMINFVLWALWAVLARQLGPMDYD